MGPLLHKRRNPSLVTFESVGVYAIGGSGPWIRGVRPSKSTSDFLPANSLQWKRGPGLPKDVSDVSRGCAVPVSKNSFIYINTGSNDTYTGRSGVIREYMINMANPTSNQGWMSANRWPTLSSWHGHGCARIGRNVLIAGGFNGGYVNGKWRDHHGEKVRNTKIIDIATRKVRLGGNLVTPRAYHRLATVTTGGLTKAFAFGGSRLFGNIYHSSVEEWDEDNLKWKPAGNLKEARAEFAAITVPLSVVCPGSG